MSPVMIDPEVVQHDTVVFAAGSREESVRIRTRDLLELEHALVTPIAESHEERTAHEMSIG
jgi:prolyl-tRNA editing enzyme YbaK/EbsC (Cys-tRNA(Pro) deacylase)